MVFITVLYLLVADKAVGHESTRDIRLERCVRLTRQAPPIRDQIDQLLLCQLWLAAARDGAVSEKVQVLSLDLSGYRRSHNVGRILASYTPIDIYVPWVEVWIECQEV
jgi:hypothetical protein